MGHGLPTRRLAQVEQQHWCATKPCTRAVSARSLKQMTQGCAPESISFSMSRWHCASERFFTASAFTRFSVFSRATASE